MNLNEFVTPQQASTGLYDPAEDKINAVRRDDTRKAKVTLKDLNRLKKMRAQKKLDNLKREDILGIIYAQDEGGMM